MGSGAPDTTSPSAPTNLTSSVVSSSQISLTWTASTDNVGVTGYRVFRNGTQVGTLRHGPHSVHGLLIHRESRGCRRKSLCQFQCGNRNDAVSYSTPGSPSPPAPLLSHRAARRHSLGIRPMPLTARTLILAVRHLGFFIGLPVANDDVRYHLHGSQRQRKRISHRHSRRHLPERRAEFPERRRVERFERNDCDKFRKFETHVDGLRSVPVVYDDGAHARPGIQCDRHNTSRCYVGNGLLSGLHSSTNKFFKNTASTNPTTLTGQFTAVTTTATFQFGITGGSGAAGETAYIDSVSAAAVSTP